MTSASPAGKDHRLPTPQSAFVARDVPAPLAGLFVALLTSLLAACGPSDPGKAQAAREYRIATDDETWIEDEERLEHLNRAVRLDPDAVAYLEGRSGYLAKLGRLHEAKSDLDRAIASKDRPYLRFRRGFVLCDMRDHMPALADFDRAIAAQPSNTQFYLGRSLARVAVGQLPEALADAETMIRQAPLHADGYYARAAVRLAEGRARESLADLTRVVRERPELAYPHALLARVHDALGDRESADAEWAASRRANLGAVTACLDPFSARAAPAVVADRETAPARRERAADVATPISSAAASEPTDGKRAAADRERERPNPPSAAPPFPPEARGSRYAYYLFLAENSQGCEACYVPLLIVSKHLEDLAKAGENETAVVITTYERDSIWDVERYVPLPAEAIQPAERRVRIKDRNFRYQEIGATEVLRLLENPEGTILIHRIKAPPGREELRDLTSSFRALR